MDLTADSKLITCILPKGKALEVVKKLHEEKGLNSVNVSSGRGSSAHKGKIQAESEVDVLTVAVEDDRADEIFEFIYYETDIGGISKGFMFQGRLSTATRFVLPEISPK